MVRAAEVVLVDAAVFPGRPKDEAFALGDRHVLRS